MGGHHGGPAVAAGGEAPTGAAPFGSTAEEYVGPAGHGTGSDEPGALGTPDAAAEVDKSGDGTRSHRGERMTCYQDLENGPRG